MSAEVRSVDWLFVNFVFVFEPYTADELVAHCTEITLCHQPYLFCDIVRRYMRIRINVDLHACCNASGTAVDRVIRNGAYNGINARW